MLTAHYAPAFIGRAIDRRVPLWMLFIAAQLVDIAHMLCLLVGIERTTLDFSLPSNPLVIEEVPYTHSLVATSIWASFAGSAAWWWLRSRRAGIVIAAVVASHWMLDYLVHRPDLTLAGGDHKLGLALWNHPRAALALELGLLAASAVTYLAALRPRGRERTAVLVAAGFLVAVQIYAYVGSPPPSIPALAVMALVMFAIATALAARVRSGSSRAS